MDNFTHHDELLVRYLDGDLPAAGKSSIEQQLAADKLLKQQFDSLLLTREAIRHYGLTRRVADIHWQMITELQPAVKKINPARRLIRMTAAVAAAIILLAGSFWLYNFFTLSGNKVFQTAYKTYQLPLTRDVNTTTTAAEEAYLQKNYTEVIRIHNTRDGITIKDEFLCGAAALELKDNAKAITCFKEVLELSSTQQPPVLKDEAEYYLSLSYIRNGDYANSLEMLKKIKNDPGHTYYTAVTQKLIRQVKMLKWR
jgi:tetratricopeptide (TPR) repeat protein